MKKTILVATLAAAAPAFAADQRVELSPEVRAFVKVDAPIVALRHLRVIDGTGAPLREDQTILIAEGKIRAIGDSAAVPIPDGALDLDLSGHTALPGLVGMHDHMYYPGPGRDGPRTYPQHAFSFPRLYLAGGVTTVRTAGSVETYADLEIKKAIDEGRTPGPKMHVTSPYLEGKGAFTPQMHELTGPDDAPSNGGVLGRRGRGQFQGLHQHHAKRAGGRH